MGRVVPRRSVKRHHNLPAHRLRLIGREQDLVVARQALLGTEGRLLTLTGTGGCGKTRLALELAADLLPSFADGVWLIELAPLAHAELVPQTMVSAVGVREQPGEALLVTLVRVLSTRQLLLVLDNCEHVIEVCARVVEQLLDRCPRLRVLATSREALRIPGEMTWRVPSLRVPDQNASAEELLRVPAVQLFVERAQASVPTFDPAAGTAAISGICRRLDGLPLAIELAAARVRALEVDQILARLDDSINFLLGGSRTAPSRQQTLRATLDWSYGLLGTEERTVLRRLAVFAESFTLDAAEAVCSNGDVGSLQVVDELQHLVDKSLVVTETRDGHVRYRLLEPIRQYAYERLSACGERGGTRRRHAMYYLRFAEARAHDTNIGGPRRITAAIELDREYPNLRAVLAWAVESKEAQVGLRLAGSLNFAWQLYGSTSEGLAWLAQILALPKADEPTAGRAWALLARAWLANLTGNFAVARYSCQEALILARQIGPASLEWMALHFSGVSNNESGDLVAAQHDLEQAAACSRGAGEQACEASSLNVLAWVAADAGDFAAAKPLAEAALHLARAASDAWSEGWALGSVGRAALGRGALTEAMAALEAALLVARQVGHSSSLISVILNLLGEAAIAAGRLDEARARLAASIKVQRERGERWSMAWTLDRLAALAAADGQPECAIRLTGASDALRESLGAQRSQSERQEVEEWLQPLRTLRGIEAVDAEWARGRALGLDDAIALALASAETLGHARLRAETGLTARQQEVTALLAHGLTNRQIAEQLIITERTVAAHIEHILDKLGFASRHQVGAWAAEHGLLG